MAEVDKTTIRLPIGPRGGARKVPLQQAVLLLLERIQRLEEKMEQDRNERFAGYPGYD